MICATRFPLLHEMLTGDGEIRTEREKALAELHAAMKRRDTRRVHKAEADAVKATCAALKVGA